MYSRTSSTALTAAMATALWLVVTGAPAVLAAERVALVIGNASYAHAPALANPLNDAADVGAALERLGFAVTRLNNVGDAELRHGLKKFRRGAGVAEVAVVFYAGHGIEMNKRNFLVPVDARLETDGDVEFEAAPLDLVMSAVEGASEFRLVVLDACRDNPFLAAMKREKGSTRSIGRGLARAEPTGGGTLLAYSAKEGTVALDGDGRNSPYTSALLRYLEQPGLEVGLMFRKVRDAVLESTGRNQEPFAYSSLSARGAYFIPPTDRDSAQGTTATAFRAAVEVEHWKTINTIEDPAARIAALLDYKAKFPAGVYANLAEIQLESLGEPPGAEAPAPAVSSEAVEAALGLTREDRRRVQRALREAGFDPGQPDGLFGRRTRAAISAWQATEGMQSTGYLGADAVKALLAHVAKPKREVPELEPSSILLASGLRLSDWVMLAEDRLASGEYRSLLVEGAGHTRSYGSSDGVASVVERAIEGLIEGLRMDDEASARTALQSVRRIKDVSGPRQALHRIEARAYSRLGRFEEAVEAYQSWIRIAPSDHPERKEMLIGLQKAQRGEMPLAPRDTFRDCAECPHMVVVPDGMYRMGSPRWEEGRDDGEGPMHDVIIGQPVAVGMYEVTFAEWDACRREGGCSHDPSDQGWGRENRPVVDVSWEDAQEYVRWLWTKTGQKYRLLSESEWEYAARGGSRSRYQWGDEMPANGANCAGCGSLWDGASTAPAGSFSANAFGLYDMHGNVWEWVEDCWHDDYAGAPSDGSAWLVAGDCDRRVLRGGSFFTSPPLVRSAYRSQDPSRTRLKLVGFRVARELD